MLSGVRQGGICSCWLFNVYMRGLVKKLERSGFGCIMRGPYVGCVLYADDIMLLSGSLIKLQKMLDICKQFAEDHDFIFNSKKSCCFAFGGGYVVEGISQMMMGTEFIDWVMECNYLGVRLVAGKTFTTSAENCRRKFCAAFNDVVINGGFLSEECLMEVFTKQCIPILMYGAAVWSMSVEAKRKLGVCFNRAIRRIFGYHDYESVKDILFGFCVLPADLQMVRAELLLCGAGLRSERGVMKMCACWQRDREKLMRVLLLHNVEYDLNKRNINMALWNKFGERVDW